jgi:hypothetical protein
MSCPAKGPGEPRDDDMPSLASSANGCGVDAVDITCGCDRSRRSDVGFEKGSRMVTDAAAAAASCRGDARVTAGAPADRLRGDMPKTGPRGDDGLGATPGGSVGSCDRGSCWYAC